MQAKHGYVFKVSFFLFINNKPLLIRQLSLRFLDPVFSRTKDVKNVMNMVKYLY